MPLPIRRPNRHRVQRQVVELVLGDVAEGPAVHRELARPFWDRAAPELESVFDSVAAPHELLRVDRLELDLGQIHGADWPLEFRRKLVAELTRSLARVTAASTPRDIDAPEPERTEPWQEFLFFLSHGYLPWWGAKPRAGSAGPSSDDLDGAGWSALRDAIGVDARARVRLIQSVDNEFLDTAIARWIAVPHAARVFEHWTPTSIGDDERQRWRRAFWMTLLDWVCVAGWRAPSGGTQLVRDLLALRATFVFQDEDRRPLQVLRGVAGPQEEPTSTARHEVLPSPWQEWWVQASMTPVNLAVPETHTNPRTPSEDARAESRPRRPAPDASRRQSDGEAIYLEGAGAILLHPFLEELFRDRGLLAERRFRDTESRSRAVHLLGLLTFGSVDVREYDLVLGKVLCGHSLDEPLEDVSLNEEDIDACDALLGAVLDHWTALRHSSPQWLRQEFLLREGKLERADPGYLLTVERRAQDVLLARLPWGVNVVSLPWPSERTFVRWLD